MAHGDPGAGPAGREPGRRRLRHPRRAAQVEHPPAVLVGQPPEGLAPVEIGGAVIARDRQAQQPAPQDGGLGIDLDQVGAGIERGHGGGAPDQAETVQVVVDDQGPGSARGGLGDPGQHLLRRDEVHLRAQQRKAPGGLGAGSRRCGDWRIHGAGGYRIRADRALDTLWGRSLSAASPTQADPARGVWGRSSVGRALRSQCRGQGFDSPRLHQISSVDRFLERRFAQVRHALP